MNQGLNAIGYQEAQMKVAQQVDRNPTVRENIESRIEMLKSEIERLERSKVDLAPLLDMRIRDIRDAMSY